jgi:hypothetical protein
VRSRSDYEALAPRVGIGGLIIIVIMYMIGPRYDEYHIISDLVVGSNSDVVLYIVVAVNVSMR